jgi:hypothetical protein
MTPLTHKNPPFKVIQILAFDLDRSQGGTSSSLGQEYVGQRDGVKTPVFADEPNIDIRIQLIRNRREKGGGFLGKVFKVASAISGIPFGGGGGDEESSGGLLGRLNPSIRVPQMLHEGVAFSQAVFGGAVEEAPLWRSGFTSFAVALGGGRLGLIPGLWVALDEGRQVDLTGVSLEDLGGRVALTRNGQELDINYLVLWFEIDEGGLPDMYTAPPDERRDYDPADLRERNKKP